MNITISSSRLTAEISPKGAELQSLRDDKQEYLWQGDAKYWADRALTIFPYVARMTRGKYTMHGKEYSMPIHGFAPTSTFTPIHNGKNFVTFRLEDSKETRAMYPFPFIFDVTYTLEDTHLSILYRVENKGNEPMYFGLGGHPGFNVPNAEGLSFEDYQLQFVTSCKPQRVGFSADCFVTGEEQPLPLVNDEILPLRHDLFDDDAIVMKDMAHCVSLFSPKGGKKISVTFPEMPYLGLWHAPKTDAPYVCIEPWVSLPSRKGVVEELSTQPGLVKLPAGETYENQWSIRIDD